MLKDLYFADDIALLSSTFNDLHEKGGRLAEEAARVGLKLNARKCKTLRTECASSREKIVVDGEEVDGVEEFTYLAAIVDKEGGGSKDIMYRLQKACGVFQIQEEGEPRYSYSRLKFGRSYYYGCETWKITKNDEQKLNSFHCQCLRRILRIR